MDRIFYVFIIFFAGICWPMQAAINSELKHRTNQPLISAMVNGGGGAMLAGMILLALGLITGRGSQENSVSLGSVPWWAWTGGVFSVIVIVAQSTSARPLGAALMVTAFLAGQVLSGLVFDQFSLMNYPHRAITPAIRAG
ncbi:MAG: DMT family transporter, partial [Planctomycetota bacterium]